MSLFRIDETKCKRDGICAAECPMKIIEMQDENSLPTPTAEAARKCIDCGHCVAVCPHGAFTHNRLPSENFPPLNKEWVLTDQQAEQFLRSRRSIRAYRDQQPGRESLNRLIDIARYSPTGTNSQQVQWLVVNSRAEVEKLTGLVIELLHEMIQTDHPMSKRYNLPGFVTAWENGDDLISRGAPALVVVHAPQEYAMGGIDCASALTYFDLAAPTLGLGCCWAGFMMLAATLYPPFQEALALPEGHTVFGMMMTGYPKFKYQRLVPRKAANITWRE